MPHSPPNPPRGEGRDEILRAATLAFAERGYAGTTTAAVARAAGVTQPLVHHHFGSKESLWHAVVDTIFEDLEHTLADSVTHHLDAPLLERVEAMLRAFIAFVGRRPELSRLLVLESATPGPTFDFIFEKHLRPQLQGLQATVALCVQQGLFRPVDLDLIPFFIIGACAHVFMVAEEVRRLTHLTPTSPDASDRFADLAVSILLDGLRARPDADPEHKPPP